MHLLFAVVDYTFAVPDFLSQLLASPTAAMVVTAIVAVIAVKHPMISAILSGVWQAIRSGGKTPEPAPAPQPSPVVPPPAPQPASGPLAEWLAQHPILAKLGAEGLHLLPLLLPLLMAKQGTDDPKLALMKELAEQQGRAIAALPADATATRDPSAK